MRRRPESDDLTTAYVVYAATWLNSWPMRRRLRRSRERRAAELIRPDSAAPGAPPPVDRAS